MYVLQAKGNSRNRYIGYTADLVRRLREHDRGESTSTRGSRWQLVYYEAYTTQSAARERERRLKSDGRIKRFLYDRLDKHL